MTAWGPEPLKAPAAAAAAFFLEKCCGSLGRLSVRETERELALMYMSVYAESEGGRQSRTRAISLKPLRCAILPRAGRAMLSYFLFGVFNFFFVRSPAAPCAHIPIRRDTHVAAVCLAIVSSIRAPAELRILVYASLLLLLLLDFDQSACFLLEIISVGRVLGSLENKLHGGLAFEKKKNPFQCLAIIHLYIYVHNKVATVAFAPLELGV